MSGNQGHGQAKGLRTTTDLGSVTGLEMEVYFNLLDGVSLKGEKVGRVDYISLDGSLGLKVLFNRWLALW